MTQIANSLSLPEALLLIRQDNWRQMESLRCHTQSRALANAAIWSKPALRALGRFERSLTDKQLNNNNNDDLNRFYRAAGVSVQRT